MKNNTVTYHLIRISQHFCVLFAQSINTHTLLFRQLSRKLIPVFVLMEGMYPI